ncbi:hypothetical protein [Weissella cibaria]|uniref:hypothetical protein n=1 Tax=Weissella cibaria TaxID=137591 RepID=UPI000F6F2E66|nr:hypothetical protein [Weissella cibaria]APU63968.1 hypothetical protein AUC65_02236 [Weissella cibaria]
MTHDQVTTDMLGTRLMVEVTDATAPDYQHKRIDDDANAKWLPTNLLPIEVG